MQATSFTSRPGKTRRKTCGKKYELEEFQEARAEISKAVELVRPLTAAGIPVYAVQGNHDYAMMTRDDVRLEWLAEEVSKTLDAAGVKVPDNEAAPLPLPENRAQPQDGEDGKPPLYIVGVGDKLARHDDPARAPNRVPKETPRLALMHNPDSFAKFPTSTAPLALAGHTHGGQIRLPFMPEWSWMSLVSADEVHADGWIDGYGQSGNRL